MDQYHLKRARANIVLVGTFFPLLFTPEWFQRNKLLPKEESISIGIMHEELTRFSLAAISVEVQRDRIVFSSDVDQFGYLVKDLALGVAILVPEVKVEAIGLNFSSTFEFDSLDFYNYIGDFLAPKECWLKSFSGAERAGLRRMEIQIPSVRLGACNHNFTLSGGVDHKCIDLSLNNHFDVDVSALAGVEFDPEKILNLWDEATLVYHDACGTLLSELKKGFLV